VGFGEGTPLPTQDWIWGRVCAPSPENLLNFQVKNAGFYVFYFEKLGLPCDQKAGPGCLVNFLGAEDIKRAGGFKI